ncbi:tRNA (adenosine(37)-N6)-dimethylallyltransferase MiaA [Aurantiacibacter sp. D1-12]|uniref:tRNA (adenosine(37)-N6)-dimethylallyltransferase MiaA n=1 Tax=Aurantiacibacter sp. D1-12 TaxID=2993658 RepID=UPI00237C73AE|nr:tRNA (adenosine(37)-N6)-dimethylallyltransferase MiaA [Aurantiacibacter sp. D1-12]MDE1466829.1 tRNA (adenosine(37)-N6)-dimethylallyltransferase MiaA [Aurantiacibacter sp. D1-12]
MRMRNTPDPLALIAGPTASGKSDCAVKLAKALEERGKSAVVINADSAQVYADLQVLSARPDEEEMQGVPHSLFGTWDGAEPCSAADWAAAAKEEIAAAHEGGAVPILVGGTGMYMSTLLDGIAPIPPIDPDVRREVRALSTDDAYSALQDADPERADMLHPSDSQRIARALEVVRSTGRTLGSWQEHKSGGIGDQVDLAPLILLPDREALYERCDTRFAAMLDQGAVEEVEALLARGLSSELPVMRAIGVLEIAGWLRGEWSREEAIERGAQSTRNYAKRQYTWFRNQPPQDWLREKPENIVIDDIFEILFRQGC